MTPEVAVIHVHVAGEAVRTLAATSLNRGPHRG
jgi:hypothetical protein